MKAIKNKKIGWIVGYAIMAYICIAIFGLAGCSLSARKPVTLTPSETRSPTSTPYPPGAFKLSNQKISAVYFELHARPGQTPEQAGYYLPCKVVVTDILGLEDIRAVRVYGITGGVHLGLSASPSPGVPDYEYSGSMGVMSGIPSPNQAYTFSATSYSNAVFQPVTSNIAFVFNSVVTYNPSQLQNPGPTFTFSWSSLPGAVAYDVTIWTINFSQNFFWAPNLTTTSCTIPTSAGLISGNEYLIQIGAKNSATDPFPCWSNLQIKFID